MVNNSKEFKIEEDIKLLNNVINDYYKWIVENNRTIGKLEDEAYKYKDSYYAYDIKSDIKKLNHQINVYLTTIDRLNELRSTLTI